MFMHILCTNRGFILNLFTPTPKFGLFTTILYENQKHDIQNTI